MPQIDQIASTYSSQIFWLLVFFGAVFVVVGRGMVPKIMDTVGQRDSQIADDLAAAKAARDRADEQEEAWRVRENDNRAAAQAIIAKAKVDAAARNDKKLSAAQARLDKKLHDAEAEIDKARISALTEVEQVAADAAQDIVQRLAGVSVSAAAAETAVKEAMAHGA